jgi:prevent-host-death family protein
MRSVTALDVRRKFGQIVDEAAAGERIVIERAGQPVAAIVPLSDLALVDPERRRAERLRAIDDIARLAKRTRRATGASGAAVIRAQRDARAREVTVHARRKPG